MFLVLLFTTAGTCATINDLRPAIKLTISVSQLTHKCNGSVQTTSRLQSADHGYIVFMYCAFRSVQLLHCTGWNSLPCKPKNVNFTKQGLKSHVKS